VPDVDAALRVLSTREEPLAVNIGRRSGQREERWMHLLAGEVAATPGPSGTDEFAAAPSSRPATSSLADRVAALEARVAALEAERGASET